MLQLPSAPAAIDMSYMPDYAGFGVVPPSQVSPALLNTGLRFCAAVNARTDIPEANKPLVAFIVACAALAETGMAPIDHGDKWSNRTIGYFQQNEDWLQDGPEVRFDIAGSTGLFLGDRGNHGVLDEPYMDQEPCVTAQHVQDSEFTGDGRYVSKGLPDFSRVPVGWNYKREYGPAATIVVAYPWHTDNPFSARTILDDLLEIG